MYVDSLWILNLVSDFSGPSSPPQTEGDILHSLKNFRFNELKNATGDFRSDHVLGGSDSGHVYKGWMDVHSLTAAKPGKGMAIAIKKIYSEERSLLGHKQWLVSILSFMLRCSFFLLC